MRRWPCFFLISNRLELRCVAQKANAEMEEEYRRVLARAERLESDARRARAAAEEAQRSSKVLHASVVTNLTRFWATASGQQL